MRHGGARRPFNRDASSGDQAILPMKIPIRVLRPALAVSLFAPFVAAQTSRLAPSSPTAGAVASPAIKLEPLRVTADLWETPAEKIPASVTLFDEQSLRIGAIRHFADLTEQIPNFTWTGGTSRPRYFQIRGIGENSQYEGETPDSAVRFLVDDLDFTGLGGVASTFDVRQVEVLRGPQAGAFGANAAGGVVRLIGNAPTPFWSGQAEASIGGDDLRSAAFALGGPLVARDPQELMFRFALQHSRSDGFRRNQTLARATNGRDELTGKLRFTWNPASTWRWEAAVLWAKLDNGFDEFALDNNGRKTYSDQPGRDEQESLGASLRGTLTGSNRVRVSTVTTASWTDSEYSYDDDWTAASYQGFSDLRRDRKVLSQEFRFDSIEMRDALGWADRWSLGAFVSRIDEDAVYTNEDPGNVRGLRTRYRGDHQALFGQIGNDLGAHTRLVVGLRVERLDLHGEGRRTRFRKVRGTFDPEFAFAPKFTDTLVGGKLTLEHDLSNRHLAFVSATRGYKGGGVNIDARISPPADPLTYATEYLWNYEAGMRGNWWDERIRGEVTAFFLDRRDTQVRDSAGFGGSYRFFTANANRAHVYGVEASGVYQFTPEWGVHGSFATMRSDLHPFVLTNGSAGGGRELANTPRYSYTLGPRYRGQNGWFGQVELVGRARHFDSNNQNEARRAFRSVNASLGWEWQNWTFSVWGRNVLDARYEKRVFFFGNEDPDYIETRYETRADPRQLGVTAAYRF